MHYRPDHLLGAVVFQVPIFALSEVKAKIEAVGDRVASEDHEKRGAIIASHAERPRQVAWASTIEGYRKLVYKRILPEHGARDGPELYDEILSRW